MYSNLAEFDAAQDGEVTTIKRNDRAFLGLIADSCVSTHQMNTSNLQIVRIINFAQIIAATVSTDCSLSFDANTFFSKPTAQQEINTGTCATDKTNKVISMILFLRIMYSVN